MIPNLRHIPTINRTSTDVEGKQFMKGDLSLLPDDLFSTNRAPTDDEREQSKYGSVQTRARLAEISPLIEELESRLRALHEEREYFNKMNHRFQLALSPFRTLPEDIIREICHACLDHVSSPLWPYQAPTVLTYISRDFRRIAMSTPALWTSIHIDFQVFRPHTQSTTSIVRMKYLADQISQWIDQRSGTFPLSITVTDLARFMPTISPLYTPVTNGIIHAVLKCCPRWRHVSFDWISFPMPAVAACQSTDAHFLRSLSLCLDGEHFVFHSHRFLRAPNLQEFALTLRRQHELETATINWVNLTHLTLEGYLWHHSKALSTITHILGQTTHLVQLYLGIPRLSEQADMEEIWLPYLEDLMVREVLDGDSLGILQLIHAPMLRDLSLEGEEISPRTGALIHLLKLSPCIEYFRIAFAPSISRLIKYLRYCPSLKTLMIGDIGDSDARSDALLEALVHNDKRERLCPHLDTFRCGVRLNVSADAVVKLYTQKWGYANGLTAWKDIYLSMYQGENHRIVVERLKEAGITLDPPDAF